MGCVKCIYDWWCVYDFCIMCKFIFDLYGVNGLCSKLCSRRIEEEEFVMECCDILKLIMVVIGVVMVGVDVFVWDKVFEVISVKDVGFIVEDISLLNEIGEIIIFVIDSLGVKVVNVGVMMVGLVVDCYMLFE